MQKALSQMTQSELSSLVIPLIAQCVCPCCGSRDLFHDATVCQQASYAAFDAMRQADAAFGCWGIEDVSPAVPDLDFLLAELDELRFQVAEMESAQSLKYGLNE